MPNWWRTQWEIARRVGADLVVIAALVVLLILVLYIAGLLRPVA